MCCNCSAPSLWSMYRRLPLPWDAAGSAVQEGHQNRGLTFWRSLTCRARRLPRGSKYQMKVKDSGKCLGQVRLLPSVEASEEALLGRLVHDLDDSTSPLEEISGASSATLVFRKLQRELDRKPQRESCPRCRAPGQLQPSLQEERLKKSTRFGRGPQRCTRQSRCV